MANYLYDGGSATATRRDFSIADGKAAIIRGDGLTEEVPIYRLVSNCRTCADCERRWEPVMFCGVPLTVGPDNPIIAMDTPGQYSVGLPDEDLDLGEDAAITYEQSSKVPEDLKRVCPAEVPPVEPPEPVPPVTLTGEDCDGAPVPQTSDFGTISYAVQPAGQVYKVQLCDPSQDRELVKRCDPDTGAEILFQWDVTTTPPTLLSATDLTTGAAWAGDAATLVSCGGPALESDDRDVCVDGVSLSQWVVKKDGEPTGVVYYTDAAGQLVAVPATAVITVGACAAAALEPEISDGFGDDLGTLLPSDNFIFDATAACSTPPCVFEIVTDAGTFRIRAGSAITTKTFSSKVTVQSVSVLSGTCSIADLHIIGNSN